MDSNSVVAIIALLCFFFFFFFFFLLGGVGFYFFIVKKKDTSEEKTSAMSSQTRISLVPIVSPLLKKFEPFDISEDKLFMDSKERLESIEAFLGSSYRNRNNTDFVEKYERSETMDDLDNTRRVNLNQSKILELEDIVSGLQKEKEHRDMKALEKKKALEEKERIETEAKRLLDNLEKAEAYPVNSMVKRRISLPGPIEDTVLQKLYKLDNLIEYKSSSDLVGDKLKSFYFIEKSSSPKNTEKIEITPEMKYQYNVNKKLHGDL